MNIRISKLLIILVFSLVIISCGEEEERNPSGARVNFRLDMEGKDNDLKNLQHYAIFPVENNNTYNFYGRSGVLVFNYGYDSNGYPNLTVLDLCCPYEDNPLVRISVNSELNAVCSKCKSEFNLIDGTGRAIAGPAQNAAKNLYNYNHWIRIQYPTYYIQN